MKLLILDWGGTIAEFKTGAILPNTKEVLANLPANTHIAIASNQGGVGLRYWMERDGFGQPSTYPNEQVIYDMFASGCSQLGISPKIYLSFAYQAKSGKWSPEPNGDETRNPNYWQREWRKPESGMLIQAMKDFGVSPTETLMIGDREEDELAAFDANCQFQWADVFFKRDGEKK